MHHDQIGFIECSVSSTSEYQSTNYNLPHSLGRKTVIISVAVEKALGKINHLFMITTL